MAISPAPRIQTMFFFRLVLPLSLLLPLAACVERFYPDVKEYEGVLVADGMITNAEGPYQVKLSRAAKLDKPDYIPVSGAVMRIRDYEGNVAHLHEQTPGLYQTQADAVQGVPGQAYRLEIELENGKAYQSRFVTMPSPLPLDSVSAAYETEQDQFTEETEEGYRFYAHMPLPQNDTGYYLWKTVETFEYHASFSIDYLYAGGIEEFDEPYKYFYCWKTSPRPEIQTLRSVPGESVRNRRIALHFAKLKKFRYKYSLYTRQLHVTQQAWNFWKQINEQNEEQGSFYTQQPWQIRGNIHNADDRDEPVLGYFFVAGESTNRIFVHHPGMPPESCIPDKQAIAYLMYSAPSTWPIYITDTGTGLALGAEPCFDCRALGGVTEKPAFWED